MPMDMSHAPAECWAELQAKDIGQGWRSSESLAPGSRQGAPSPSAAAWRAVTQPAATGSRWLWGALRKPGCEVSKAPAPHSSPGRPVHKERRGDLITSDRGSEDKDHFIQLPLHHCLQAETGPLERKTLAQAHTTGLETRLPSPWPGPLFLLTVPYFCFLPDTFNPCSPVAKTIADTREPSTSASLTWEMPGNPFTQGLWS